MIGHYTAISTSLYTEVGTRVQVAGMLISINKSFQWGRKIRLWRIDLNQYEHRTFGENGSCTSKTIIDKIIKRLKLHQIQLHSKFTWSRFETDNTKHQWWRNCTLISSIPLKLNHNYTVFTDGRDFGNHKTCEWQWHRSSKFMTHDGRQLKTISKHISWFLLENRPAHLQHNDIWNIRNIVEKW